MSLFTIFKAWLSEHDAQPKSSTKTPKVEVGNEKSAKLVQDVLKLSSLRHQASLKKEELEETEKPVNADTSRKRPGPG